MIQTRTERISGLHAVPLLVREAEGSETATASTVAGFHGCGTDAAPNSTPMESRMPTEKHTENAVAAIALYRLASRRLADAVRLEAEMEAHRPQAKLDAILRLQQTPDPRYPLSDYDREVGKPVKLLAATEAEKYVERDETYASYILNLRNLVHSRMRAQADAVSARLEAMLWLSSSEPLAGVLV